MKRIVLMMGIGGILLGLGIPNNSWAVGQLGLGWQYSSLASGISGKAAISPNFCLQGIVGYNSLTMNDPIIKSDGEEEKLDMTITMSAITLGGRGLFKVKREENMDVYVGGGLTYFRLSGDIDVEDESFEGSGGAIEFNSVGGVEYRFQGLPNLALSTEIGFSYLKLNDIDLKFIESTGEVEKATLIPNTSIKNLFLGAGIHYYF